MKIMVERIVGDATVSFYNKQRELIHVEKFFGKTMSSYIRVVPVDACEFGYAQALYSGVFDYKVVVV